MLDSNVNTKVGPAFTIFINVIINTVDDWVADEDDCVLLTAFCWSALSNIKFDNVAARFEVLRLWLNIVMKDDILANLTSNCEILKDWE